MTSPGLPACRPDALFLRHFFALAHQQPSRAPYILPMIYRRHNNFSFIKELYT